MNLDKCTSDFHFALLILLILTKISEVFRNKKYKDEPRYSINSFSAKNHGYLNILLGNGDEMTNVFICTILGLSFSKCELVCYFESLN